MNVRRFSLVVAALLCWSLCAVFVGMSSAAAAPLFGSAGNESGQIQGSYGMAVDSRTGGIYVGDQANNRIDKFDGSGQFAMSWGWGVSTGVRELQTCTSSCRAGLEGTGAGQFCLPNGVTVDNDPLSASYGDVYVVSFCANDVQKFDPNGKFLLEFGGHVNERTGGDICVVGEACKGGTEGSVDGEFEWAYSYAYIAMGPGGTVYVGDKARVQIFESSGAWKQNVSLSALSTTGAVDALAVNSAGDMFVKDSGAPGVHEIEPNGTEMSTQIDATSNAVIALSLNQAGDLFVDDTTGGEHFLEFSPSGKELESFSARPLQSPYRGASMAFDDALGELLVYGRSGPEPYEAGVWAFASPPPGPVIEPGTEAVTPELRGAATLTASINPEGAETSYRFEYVDLAKYETDGFTSAFSTAPKTITSTSFDDQSVSTQLTGLVPAGTYHYRVIASNAQGSVTGLDQSFTTIPPAYIDGPWVSDVASTSATLSARVNPLGAATTYRLEYGTGTDHEHVLRSGSVGEGMGYLAIGEDHLQELEPNTTYHYRVVTSSIVGTVEGPDHTFTTQPAGRGLALPDQRMWELVSPADKGGALFEGGAYFKSIQAAVDGNGLAYQSSEPVGEDPVGHGVAGAQLISTRGPDGWVTRDVSIRDGLPAEGEWAGQLLWRGGEKFQLFSSDLSSVVVQPGSAVPPLSHEATETTLYLRNDASETYVPLVSPANAPSGEKWGGQDNNFDMQFYAATPDLNHIILGSFAALTPEAIKNFPRFNLYEWSGGRLQLVNVFPDGTTEPGTSLGSEEGELGMTSRAISSDGRWVVWKTGGVSASGETSLYVRDMIAGKTVHFGGRYASFQAMSDDGSKIFYLETEGNSKANEGELYVFDTATDRSIDLTSAHAAGEHGSAVQNALMGVGKDGSYVYFVAKGVLSPGAKSGADNLYVARESGGMWSATYITTLTAEDEKDWFAGSGRIELPYMAATASPNGRFLAFMSNSALTKYDNTDAVSGQPDEEVYLYDAVTQRLVCASCDPTGARPAGMQDMSESGNSTAIDPSGAWSLRWSNGDHWLAASLPPAWRSPAFVSTYQPRDVSNEGRLFFNSIDSLVPQDTNGTTDVYEYEPLSVGSCATSAATYSGVVDGCVSLISSGTAIGESTFFDASETGGDVFFATGAKLTAEDHDAAYDIYDAHVCSAAVPCRALPVAPPPCTSGDSCKVAPSPQPEIFGPAPSATFSGTGNVVQASRKSGLKAKATKPKHHRRKKSKRRRKAHKARIRKTTRKGKR